MGDIMDKKRVLVADDDLMWRSTLREELEELGCKVDVASNYEETRALLEQNKYALIISDNKMPPIRRAGLQLLAFMCLEEQGKQRTPFVVHTSDENNETIKRVEEFGGIYRNKGSDEDIHEFLKKLLDA